LTGERGHYELVAGNDPLPYLEAMVAMSGSGGMLPEQVWDSAPIPARDLFPGRPSGSAMPLVWAHAEYVKLLISSKLGHPIDRPSATWQRYQGLRPAMQQAVWLPQAPLTEVNIGQTLHIAVFEPSNMHWSIDAWQSQQDTLMQDTGLGLHVAVIDTQTMQPGQQIEFTFQREDNGAWEGRNYTITLGVRN